MATFLLSIGVMFICSISFSSGHDHGHYVFPCMTLKEIRDNAVCIANNGSQKAVDEFGKCRGPVYIHALFYYCNALTVPEAKSLKEMFEKLKKDHCIADRVMACIINNVHCITCKDKYIKMREYEDCIKDLGKKYCGDSLPDTKCHHSPDISKASRCCSGRGKKKGTCGYRSCHS